MTYSLDDIDNIKKVLERGQWVTIHSLGRELNLDINIVKLCLTALLKADLPIYYDEKRNRYILINKYNIFEVMDVMEEYGQVVFCMSCQGLMVIKETNEIKEMQKCPYCGADKDGLLEFGETIELSEEMQIVSRHLPKDKFLFSPEEVERTYEKLFGKKMNKNDEDNAGDAG